MQNRRDPDRSFLSMYDGLPDHACAKGQVLVNPDEEPRGVFIIREGFVKAYSINEDGESQLIAILSTNEIFPLYWAFDEEQSQLFYETLSPTIVSVLPKSDFKTTVMHDNHLMQIALGTFLDTFRFSHQRIYNLQLRSARQRLACRLLYLGDHFGTPDGNRIKVDMPVIYQDLADAISITRETTNRVMSSFITDGLVTRSRNHLLIEDPAALKHIATTTQQ